MNKTIISRPLTIIYNLIVTTLAVSGMGQMPIFKRYYLADIPGFSWLGKPYITHQVHYLAAVLLLVALFYFAAGFFSSWRLRYRLTSLGATRISLFLIIVITGIMRVLKNNPDINYNPTLMITLDLVHIGSAVALGIVCLILKLAKKQSYLIEIGK